MGYNPIILNMANQNSPGGGFRKGHGAQEENLHRRSNYYQSLQDPDGIQGTSGGSHNYPIPIHGAIYSPNIAVFRSTESEGYAFIKPERFSFIACAALNRPDVVYNRNPKGKAEASLADAPARTMRRKIETIFGVAGENGHDAVVLSAFGCGAFRNPPRHVATLFREVLGSKEFSGMFKLVAFGIFNDHNSSGEGNVKPFADAFSVPIEKISELNAQ
eukprot:TRINITY_DN13107_c0_g1_i1.p1 TRINITY_DN13107_c0_g1~~TRINITY_DN13107_c0_g1_i1.p1  ORF type:complete len:229 (+),score=23.76 TRINITY_DN13107_c0_g1_i1:38-688(+)